MSSSGRLAIVQTQVKTYTSPPFQNTWRYQSILGKLFLTPINSKATVLIKNDLIVEGSIINPSDLHLKNNIENLSDELSKNLMKLEPKKYVYKNDIEQNEHFGFIAQDVEQYFPSLVKTVSLTDSNLEHVKMVNYIELIPVLLLKIKDLQSQIDILNNKI
jgi:hypothetical protein